MKKDFSPWSQVKETVHGKAITKHNIYFKEREVWWISLGLNIGDEEDGKGLMFERPVVIIKKFNNNLFWGCALSSKLKDNKYYLPVLLGDIHRSAIISQVRVLDSKRLSEKMGTMPQEDFIRIKKAIKDLL